MLREAVVHWLKFTGQNELTVRLGEHLDIGLCCNCSQAFEVLTQQNKLFNLYRTASIKLTFKKILTF